MRRSGKGMKAAINDALRRAFASPGKTAQLPRFVVKPHKFGVRPGIDLDRINQLVDELEAEETARKAGR